MPPPLLGSSRRFTVGPLLPQYSDKQCPNEPVTAGMPILMPDLPLLAAQMGKASQSYSACQNVQRRNSRPLAYKPAAMLFAPVAAVFIALALSRLMRWLSTRREFEHGWSNIVKHIIIILTFAQMAARQTFAGFRRRCQEQDTRMRVLHPDG